MRWISKVVVLAAMLTMSAVAVMAQAKECTDEFKTATYTKWFNNRQDNQALAYEAANEYLTVCPTDDSPYATALRNFKKKYEDLKATQSTAAQFQAAIEKNNYAEQVRLGKQIVAGSPDNALVYIYMANAGLNDASVMPDSAQAAKKAIELIEAGKPVTPAYQTKDQALAAMNYVIAKSTMKASPTDAIPYFIKAAKYESDLKKSPLVYNELAAAYGEGPVAKFAKDYQALAVAGKSVDSPEAKLVIANLNQALDRQIDAFARAAAVSTSPADKKAFMEVLGAVYKDRNKKDPAENELNNLVAGALSRPLPDPPSPITTLPTPTAPAGAGSGSGSVVGSPPPPASAAPGGSSPMKPSNTAASSAPKTGGTGTAAAPPSSGTKPTASPTPKPKQPRNHRGR